MIRGERISFAELPDVLVFGDDSSASLFYASSGRPRLVRDSDGKPEINLLLYGKKSSGSLVPSGGVLTATVSLEMTPSEEQRLADLLRQRTAAPQVVPVAWLEGEVEFRPAANLSAIQVPSLFGDNRCSFSVRLSAEQAAAIGPEWEKGLPNSMVVYKLRVQAGPASFSQTRFTSTFDSTAGGSTAFSQTSTSRAPLTLELGGPLDLTSGDLQSGMSTVEI
jgi:hypothetical protein